MSSDVKNNVISLLLVFLAFSFMGIHKLYTKNTLLESKYTDLELRYKQDTKLLEDTIDNQNTKIKEYEISVQELNKIIIDKTKNTLEEISEARNELMQSMAKDSSRDKQLDYAENILRKFSMSTIK